MSRIGRAPVEIPAGVTVSMQEDAMVVKGPLGTLTQYVDPVITLKVDGNVAHFTRANEEKDTKAKHGLYRALLQNMVTGVSKGYQKNLVIAGVGYKVQKQGNSVVMNIGFSHPVEYKAQEGITLECPNPNEIAVKGISKEQVGQVAAEIRAIKKPEPYHGYGIHYSDEVIQRKEGKTAGK